ncbi:MAG TPA: hypothetical protein VNN15_04450 [Solirubrobacterales bacterium]|nr:hypothetical protein [Solirubrobacterales bacterium]
MKKLLSSRRLASLLPLMLLLPGVAQASEVHSETFPGGAVTVSANDGFTEGKLESLTYAFDSCGTEEYESSCKWEVAAHLASEPTKRCNPATPGVQTIWSSGEQSGNGTVGPPPLSFPLEGCPGQVFSVSYSYTKTFNPPPKEGEWIRLGEGGSATRAFIIFGPTWQETIENGSPPAPTFQPNFTPTKTFAVSLDCGSLALNSTRYAFAFQRMGCHKASNLARIAFLTGQAPNGYACRRKGSVLCWRQGQPQKYFEWRRPGAKPAHA